MVGNGNSSSGSSSSSSTGRGGGGIIPNGEYHIHHHSHFPPPAHHHHQIRNDNLRAAEVLHAQLIRDAHTLKPASAWGNGAMQPQSFHRQDMR